VLKRANGGFVPLQTVSTLPEDFTGHSTCADLCLSPDGGFVYATNRGYDSIAVFKRDSQSGQLVPVSIIPSGGRTPRSFTMDPSGSYLVVAHQESDTVVIFSVDGKSGLLEPIEEVSIPSPSCVCLYGLL
jgi:6-phosphogluconolactonase